MPLDNEIKLVHLHGKKPLILVTNDDGIYSKGLKALTTSLKKIAEVLVVAPTVEQSAASHALTLHRPLRCNKVAHNCYAVDGTPTDCINLAINFMLKGRSPDVIFSGINKGPNLGDDVHYSGTVSAAMEGGVMGIPSVAVSVVGSLADAAAGVDSFKYDAAAKFSLRLARAVLKNGLPRGIILNVNVPNLPPGKIRGYEMTFQGKKNYSNITTEKLDPRGRKYYWISGEESGFDDIPGSDCNAVGANRISVTPIRVNLTDHGYLKKIKGWNI